MKPFAFVRGFGVALSGLLSVRATAAPTILNHSIQAEPGAIIALQGDDFGAAPEVWCAVNGGTYSRLATLNAGDDSAAAQLPYGSNGLFSVFVRGTNGDSAVALLNQARGLHFSTSEIWPGMAFELYGRNLFLGTNYAPRVELVNVSNAAMYAATVGAAPGFHRLALTAPTGLVAGTYDVWVSHGAGDWATTKRLAEQRLVVRSAGIDPWNLGVGWAADFTFHTNRYNVLTDPRLTLHAAGDGVSNDVAAINAAIDMASTNGGGVVVLPAGIYKVVNPTNTCINLKSRVVLEGEGMDATIIRYGYGTPPPAGQQAGLAFRFSGFLQGAANLQLTNVNESGAWVDSIYSSQGGPTERYFLSGVRLEKSTDNSTTFYGQKYVIQDCVIRGLNGLAGRLESNEVKLARNVITWSRGTAVGADFLRRGVIVSNVFQLDGSATTNLSVRHFVTCNFARDLYIADNQFNGINAKPIFNNDTEMILSEGGGASRAGESNGVVLSATGNVLVVDNPASNVAGSVLCLVHGRGRGQWQEIVARTGATITVATNWLVTPDASTRYATFRWSTRNLTIFNNSFTNGRRGIWIYAGASTDLAITSNRIVNADGIYLRPDQRLNKGLFVVIYNTQVIGNRVEQNDGLVPAYISLQTAQANPSNTWGTGTINVEVRGNDVRGSGATNFPGLPYPYEREGYICRLVSEQPLYGDEGIPALLGAVFQWNRTSNSARGNFGLNSGSYRTILANNLGTTPANISDTNLNGTAHASVGTFFRSVPDVTITTLQPAGEWGGATGTILLARSGPTNADLAVDLTLAGTATPGTDFVPPATRVFFPAGASNLALAIEPVPDTLPEGDETISLTLVNDSIGHYAPSNPSSALLVLADTPADAWRYARFSAADRTNDAIAGFTADPDGDGHANLAEYAADGNPTNADFAAKLAGVLSNGLPALRLLRNTNAVDVTLFVEAADALVDNAPWQVVAINSNGLWSGTASAVETGTNPVAVAIQDAAPATNRVLRLRITRP